LLPTDAPLAASLEVIPAEDWCRTWPSGRTIMMRSTSKRVKEVVDKMRLPAVVRLNRRFSYDDHNDTGEANLEFVFMQVAAMTDRDRITTLELPFCDMKGQDVQKLGGLLGQCRELVHLNLCGNTIEAAGSERLAGVLGQCAALTHLDLSFNEIGDAGTASLAGVLGQYDSDRHVSAYPN